MDRPDAMDRPGMKVFLRDPTAFAGRVELPVFESERLRGNRAGDPHVREVPVYVPPGNQREPLPVVFLLVGFTGNGREFLESHPWKLGVIAQLDREIAAGRVPPALFVMPNAFTKLGGSQYVNSGFLGPYEDYVALELVPWIDSRYPTRRGRRAVVGKSSGGFGAMHLSMRHPDVFPVAASISGDVAFEWCHAPSFLGLLRALVPYGGDPTRFLDEFLRNPELSGDGHDAINALAMSACYSPNLDAPLGFDLPFDLRTGERVDAVWQRWLEFDPLFACRRHAESWKKLELLHLECGLRDEYHLQWGLRRLVDELKRLGVPHEHEEHEGTHRNLNHRYLAVLPKVIEVLLGRGAGI